MKAIQIVAPGRLELTDCLSRLLRAWEVRIAVAATCVCGSDLKNIMDPVLVPQVPGHEFAGAVVEVSAEARGAFQAGDRVTAFPMIGCMKCVDCQESRFRDCVRKLSLGFQLPGSFAEEVIVDARLVIPLPDNLSYEQGALVEHLCCGYRLAKEILAHQMPTDSHIVILGDGPIALADVQALRFFGYRNVTLIGKYPLRMGVARGLGASRILGLSEVEATVGSESLPPAAALIMAAPAEQTLSHLLRLLRPRSLVFPQSRIRNQAILRSLEESKVFLGRAFAYEIGDFAEVIELIGDGGLDTDSLITSRIDLLELAEEFSTATQKGNHVKTVIINKRLNEIVESYERTTA